MRTILLLLVSNIFMTFAWYGNLKFTTLPLWKAILISWLIAFFEYCFMVPANRLGYLSGDLTAPQLKIIQEVVTLIVFAFFSVLYLNQPIRWNYFAAFGCIIMAVYFIFRK